MTIITAVELRKNLDEVVRRVRKGEQIKVTHRGKPAFVLQADQPASPTVEPGSPVALRELFATIDKAQASGRLKPADPVKSWKDQYREGSRAKHG